MISHNLNIYRQNDIIDICYDDVLNLPVRYPEYIIQRPLADEYLFYKVPNKKFYNYFKQ